MPPHSYRSLTIAAISACVLLVAIPIVVLRARSNANSEQAWEEQHHAELVHLKSDAEGLAIEGKLAEAHARYRAIQDLVGGRQIKDPLIWDMLEQCKADQDRVYAVLLKKMERSVIPVVPETAPTTQPSVQRQIPAYPKE